MGCSCSALSAIYDAVVPNAGDFWVNERRFRVLKQIGEGGYAFVYLVKELPSDSPLRKPRGDSYLPDDGTYALKKVLVQSEEQLELVKREIAAQSRFNHPNLLPLLDHSVISTKGVSGGWTQEAYFVFPVYREGTLADLLTRMQEAGEYFSPNQLLLIFSQICRGLQAMHHSDPPYAHNDIKPGNVLLSQTDGTAGTVLMDFGSSTPAQRCITNRKEALTLQEWAAQHCTAPYRAPELWDTPSRVDIDERTDIWSLGCTFYAMMYRVNPFEFSVNDKGGGGSLALAAISGNVQWPSLATPKFPESFHAFTTWMLITDLSRRPRIDAVMAKVEHLLATLPP